MTNLDYEYKRLGEITEMWESTGKMPEGDIAWLLGTLSASLLVIKLRDDEIRRLAS